MKNLFVGLTLLVSMSSFAANTVESYHLESEKGWGYPDLLIRVLDNGTCSSETSNFDGTKDTLLTKCSVSEFEWTTMKTIKSSSCAPISNQDPDGTESYLVKRNQKSIEIAGVTLVKASQKVIQSYNAMGTCN